MSTLGSARLLIATARISDTSVEIVSKDQSLIESGIRAVNSSWLATGASITTYLARDRDESPCCMVRRDGEVHTSSFGLVFSHGRRIDQRDFRPLIASLGPFADGYLRVIESRSPLISTQAIIDRPSKADLPAKNDS